MESKKKELLKNTLIIFLGKISTQFLAFFLLPLYTRYLVTDDYGTIDLLLTYITLLVPIISIEIEMGAFRFLIEARDDDEKKSEVILNSFSILKKVAILFLLIYCIILFLFKSKYSLFVGICIFSMMLSNLVLQIARGLGKNLLYSVASFLTGLINISFNIILIVMLKKSAISILISTFISNFVCFIFLFVKLDLISSIKNGKDNKDLQKKILKFSLPLVPNTISWWLINASDRTIVSIILGVSANGIYAISTKFSSIISSFLNIFNMSWTESASLHIDDEDCNDYFSSINDSILRLFSGICILIIAFMPILFRILIDSKYHEAYMYIPINILASFFSCMISIYSSIYVAKKMTKQVATTSIMAAFINIIVDILLIRYIGLFAASISSAVAYIIMVIYRSIDLKKYVKIKYNLKNIIIIIVGFFITITLYYNNNLYFQIFNYVFAIMYTLLFNIYIIKSILKKILKK